MQRLILGMIAALTLPIGSVRPQDDEVRLAVARFHRGQAGTAFEGRCAVPFGMIEALLGPRSEGAYRVRMVVRDSSGLTLTEQSWTQRVPAGFLRLARASAVEQFRFLAAPGSYDVEVEVTDSVSGRITRAGVRVTAFDEAPLASDLLLSSAIRQVTDTGPPGPGEMRLGSFVLAAQVEPVLTLQEPRLYYYVELYPGRETTALITATVLADSGGDIVATSPEPVQVQAAGVVSSGVDLTGLPPGRYRLRVAAQVNDTAVAREAPFRMAGFETQAALEVLERPSAGDVFTPLTEDQLDTLYAPLVLEMQAGERGIYGDLSVEGKRNYLRRFWARRDPTPGTERNERQEEFYALIARVNELYREGGAAQISGWRTDRGRIFIRYGEPDEVLRRPQATQTRPYEAWKYTRGRYRKFVFQDETGLGHYRLIYTNERQEPSLPDWQQRLGPEAVQDIERF